MIKVSAPGKLFLSGEWAILEMGNPGIVASVNKRVFAEIDENQSDFIEVRLDDFGIENAKGTFDGKGLRWEEGTSEEEEARLMFTKAAIEAVLQYLEGYKPFKLRSWGEMSSVEVEGER